MDTIGGPENSSWCLVVFILRDKQSKLLAVASCLGVYILSFGRRYVVDSIAVVEMCCYILREHKYSHRFQCQRTLRFTSNKFIQQVKENIPYKETPLKYWQYIDNTGAMYVMKRYCIKHKKTDQQGISSIKQDGKLITDSVLKADVMNHQFRSSFFQEQEIIHRVYLMKI